MIEILLTFLEVLTLITQFILIFILHSYELIDSNLCANVFNVIILGVVENLIDHVCLPCILGDVREFICVDFGIVEEQNGMVVFRGW